LQSISISKLLFAGVLLVTTAPWAGAHAVSNKASEMLPNELGKYHQLSAVRPLETLTRQGMLAPETFRAGNDPSKTALIGGETEYLSPTGERLTVEIIQFEQDTDAYSFLTLIAKTMQAPDAAWRISLGEVGTASVTSSNAVAFFKGTTFVRITKAEKSARQMESALALAHLFADGIDKGENDIPVLLRHLPNWETARANAVYVVSATPLKNQVGDQPVLDSLNFEGGTEAVVANYSSSQLVIVEFTTPQLAADNDRRIIEKIHELWSQGKPAPTGYRRVGNYSVFVFHGSSGEAANQLIDQVHYEQVVQWLGDNPHWLEAAQKRYVDTTLGVFVSVVKASGVAFVLCFGIGGLFGGLLFFRRRAQQRVTAYSDAGGMMRLNLDELTGETDARRLIGTGMPDES
jgi:hypothetical protein